MVDKHQFAKAFKTAFHIDDDTMKNLLDSFSGIRDGFKQVIDAVSPVKSTFTDANSGFSLLNRGLNGVSSTLNLVRPVLPILADLIKTFERLPQPVQTGIAAIVLFGGQMRSVIQPISGVVNILKTVTSGIGSVSGAIGGLISQRLSKTQALTGLAESLEDAGSNASGAAPKISNAAKSMETLDSKAAGAVGNTGKLSQTLSGFNMSSIKFAAATVAVTGYLSSISDQIEKTNAEISDFSTAMKSGADGVSQWWSQIKSGELGQLGFWENVGSEFSGTLSGALDKTGTSWETFRRAVEGSSSAMEELEAKRSGIKWDGSNMEMGTVIDQAKKLREAYKETIKEMVDYSNTAQGINSASSSVSHAFSELSTTLKANGDDLSNNRGLTDASSQAIQSATDSLMVNVQQQLAYGRANGTLAQSTQAAKNEVQQMRDQLTQTLQSMGMSEQQAGAYADTLGLIPGNVGTTITENSAMTKGQVQAYLDTLNLTPKQKTTVMNALTAQANGDTNNLHVNYDRLPREVKSLLTANNNDALGKTGQATTSLRRFDGTRATATIDARDNASGVISNIIGWIKAIPRHVSIFFTGHASGGLVHRAFGGPIQHLASGGPSGFVTGPGTTTSDSIPTMLSDQEYVLRAWAAKRIGIDNLNRMNATGSMGSDSSALLRQIVVLLSAQPMGGTTVQQTINYPAIAPTAVRTNQKLQMDAMPAW